MQHPCSALTRLVSQLCPTGRYSRDAGSIECAQCLAVVNANRTRCLTDQCQAGSHYDEHDGCVECDYGTYAPRNGSRNCLPCPSNMQCAGMKSRSRLRSGSRSCRDGFARADEGYWAFETNAVTGQAEAALCPRDTACIGGGKPGDLQCAAEYDRAPNNVLCGRFALR